MSLVVRARPKEVHMARKQIAVSVRRPTVTLSIAVVLVVLTFPLKTASSVKEAQPGLLSTLSISENVAAERDNSCQQNMGAYRIGELRGPLAIYCPEAACTTKAMKAHCQGADVLSLVVNAKGRVTEVQVVKGLGGEFDQSAMKTVRTWRFKPATLRGRPVPARVDVEIHFSMPGKVRTSMPQDTRN
jgi:TonB family protein